MKKHIDNDGQWKKSFSSFSPSESFWKDVNGHDIVSAIYYVNNNIKNKYFNNTSTSYSLNRAFEIALINIYDLECCKNTPLYHALQGVDIV